jgi:hypothetical protein
MTVEHRLLTVALVVLLNWVKYKVVFLLGGGLSYRAPVYLLRRL